MTSESDSPTCAQIESWLDDLLDDQLSDERKGDASRHLAGCEACRDARAGLEAMRREVASLPRSIDPTHDLWPEIASRLEPRQPGMRDGDSMWVGGKISAWRPYGLQLGWRQAAAALFFMALGALVSQLMLPGWNGSGPGSVNSTIAANHSSGGAVPVEFDPIDGRSEFALAEAGYLRAKESLWSVVYNSHAASPEVREVVERNLLVISEAIRELRAALHSDPGNQRLENRLLTQHRSEIDLLRRLASSEI